MRIFMNFYHNTQENQSYEKSNNFISNSKIDWVMNKVPNFWDSPRILYRRVIVMLKVINVIDDPTILD